MIGGMDKRSSSAPREIVIVVYPGVQSLDLTGPLEVFATASGEVTASGEAGGPAYEIRTASVGGVAVRTSSGLTIAPDAALADDYGHLTAGQAGQIAAAWASRGPRP